MRIKRLDITGFKSFMERSLFSFDDGVTGIVGPNGCGKSNVVDAIRWAMGEQSAKNLRGRGMEDVIFNGSESQAPLNMAEVSLTFTVNESDALAPPYAGFPEVTVTRRLFRSGESEYLINKTTCRLLDITELFLGTGVGTRAYSIIEQGRVGLIVSAKPEDRRSLIEEAAGVTKYKARRKAAERKMEYTQGNLLRITDIVNEQEKRLDSLHRQAKKAEKFKRLKGEMREIELHAASHRFLELHAEEKALKAQLDSLGEEEKANVDRVRQLEDEISQRRENLEREQQDLTALQQEVSTLEAQVQLDQRNLEIWASDEEETTRRMEEARAEQTELMERKSALLEREGERAQELQNLSGTWKEDDVAMQVAQEEVRRVTSLQAQLSAQLELERASLLELATRLANHENNLRNLARQRADLDARIAKCNAEAEILREEEKNLDSAREDVARRVGETRQVALDLAERRGAEEKVLHDTRQAFTENEIQVISLREELTDKRSRLTSLQEIQRNYEGFDRGVRAVMLQAQGSEGNAREKGIFGLVADILSATPQYEKAIEAALGDKLQHVVVESQEKGFELVSYLRSLSEGRGSFLPVECLSSDKSLAAPDLSFPGVLAAASSEVKVEEGLSALVQALLGDVVIVSDLSTARAYSRSGGNAFTLVTMEGEVLRPDGSMTGGTLEGPAIGALQKKRQIEELSAEVASLEERYNEIITRHYQLQKQMGHSEGVLKGLSKNQHAEELNLATQEKDLHKAGEDLARLRERLGSLEGEGSQLSQSLAALAAEEEASRGEVAHGQTEREGREEKVQQMNSELESLRLRADALSQELTSLRVKVAANGEKGESARKDLEQIAAQKAELESRMARLQELTQEGEARLQDLRQRSEEARSGQEERRAGHATKAERLGEWRTLHTEAFQSVREQDAELKELRGRLDQLTQGLSQFSLKEREIALELQHLQDNIRERHRVELVDELHRYHLLPSLTAEAELRLKELRSQLEKMGEINLTAIEEHAELSQRYEFLSGQKKDLEASLEQLREAITRINRTSRERFQQTFDVVNEKFQAIFPRLFGGGKAALVLTEEGPGLEAGVEIVAQPPGKKLQSMNLLSGGEKALTAVSLIFAIFLIKPTPFCLLDEVDAPLDEANVGRYNEMVKEMSKASQFILITHNKRTMEIADTLYGVTMEEPGISKLVSVKMHEAAAANDDAAVA